MKDKLNQLFKGLRKKGYFARQDFWCCQTCASNAIPDKNSKKYVYYHRQDTEMLQKTNSVYIAWSGNGRQIATFAQDLDLKVNWNGSKDQRIQIYEQV